MKKIEPSFALNDFGSFYKGVVSMSIEDIYISYLPYGKSVSGYIDSIVYSYYDLLRDRYLPGFNEFIPFPIIMPFVYFHMVSYDSIDLDLVYIDEVGIYSSKEILRSWLYKVSESIPVTDSDKRDVKVSVELHDICESIILNVMNFLVENFSEKEWLKTSILLYHIHYFYYKIGLKAPDKIREFALSRNLKFFRDLSNRKIKAMVYYSKRVDQMIKGEG